MKCKVCNYETNSKIGFANHLRSKHSLSNKEYYDKYLKTEQEGKCRICGKPTKFKTIYDGYSIGCCMKHTNIALYGEDYAKISEETKKKISEKIKSKECQDKIKKTNLEKYGVERYTNQEKTKNTCLKKYGVDNVFKSKDIQSKIKSTKLELYGNENYSNRNKMEATMLTKYGGIGLASDTIKNKVKKTCIKKYGVDCSLKSDDVRKKIQNTNISKYGSISPLSNRDIREKSKETCLEKYGVQYAIQNKNVRAKNLKSKLDNIEQFEKENHCVQLIKLIDIYGQGWYTTIGKNFDYLTYRNSVFVKNSDIDKIKEYIDNHIDIGRSFQENELLDYIKSIYSGKIISNDRSLIAPYEVDIYIPDKKLAIEFNGIYWHSTLHNQDKNYHIKKSKLCEEKGVRLIHIYEWELKDPYWDKIKSLLNISLGIVPSKIYARNCTLKEITNKEAKDFNDKNHLQNHRNAQITYGLFYNGSLVQLMSFSKTKYNKNLKDDNSWEIIRGCPGSNNIVIGGVDKLFKYFINNNHPSKVFSYCDFNKFDGNSYEKIGMKFIGYTGPDKTWIINRKPVKRNPFKYQQLKNSAEAIMWGSGSKKYIWEAK